MASFKHKFETKKHLFNLIKKRLDDVPNFTLLIGAGASITSGVKSAREMIREWRHQLYINEEIEIDYEEWLNQQEWYQQEHEYSFLFEKLYSERSLRRICVEDCIKDSKPNWGYLYLSNLIEKGYFNVIFTPNFDDLVNEACFAYAGCKPIVCAHDSAVRDVRITSARPEIIKLHGDFLYENLKNTLDEVEDLEENMKNKFIQFSREFGMIVIGYGGNDESIMRILQTLSKTSGYVPNGIYWCVRKTTIFSRKLQRLLQNKNVHLVEIDGFDEFMAELHEYLEISLPDIISDPLTSIKKSLNRFILPTERMLQNSTIKKDVLKLENEIIKFEKIISGEIKIDDPQTVVPKRQQGLLFSSNRDYINAIKILEGIEKDERDIFVLTSLGVSYAYLQNNDDLLRISNESIEKYPEDIFSYGVMSLYYTQIEEYQKAIVILLDNVNLIESASTKSIIYNIIAHNYALNGEYESALENANIGLEYNPEYYVLHVTKQNALKHLGDNEYKDKLLEIVDKIDKNIHKASLYAVIEDKEKMMIELRAALDYNMYEANFFIKWTEFENYKEDEDILYLIEKYRSKIDAELDAKA